MCSFFSAKPQTLSSEPGIEPRQETDVELPDTRTLTDPDDAKSIDYGTSAKKAGPAAGKKTGTDQLKINLNTGGENTGSRTGGANV